MNVVMRSQVSVHVVVVFVFVIVVNVAVVVVDSDVVVDVFFAVRFAAVHGRIRVVALFRHHTVRVTVVVVRLIVGTGPLFHAVIFAARIWWPARSSLPVGPKTLYR